MKKIISLFLCFTLLLTSCNKQQSPEILSYTQDAIPAYFIDMQWRLYSKLENNGSYPITGDISYAVVNYDWLFSFYRTWRSELFDLNIVRWDDKFDCNKFTASFISRAQIEYYNQVWKQNKPQSLALAEVWFYRQPNDKTAGHAIVAALTNNGLIFFEPQEGKQIFLTKEQQASIFLKKF